MQISTKPHDAKKLISASLPPNISAADKAALESKWNDAARAREESIARETRIPTDSSIKLRFELRKFGRHWNAYYKDGARFVPLLGAPSLLSSALDMLVDKMSEEANRA